MRNSRPAKMKSALLASTTMLTWAAAKTALPTAPPAPLKTLVILAILLSMSGTMLKMEPLLQQEILQEIRVVMTSVRWKD